jgi:hypothetical protein
VSSTDERGDGSVGITQTMPAVPADGDDIVVIPGGTPDDPRGRQLWLLVGAAIVSIGVIVAAVALFTRHDGKTAQVQVQAHVPPPTVAFSTPKKPVPKVHPAKVLPVIVAPRLPAPVVQTPAVSSPAVGPTPTVPQPAPTVALPKQYGPSVLTWNAPKHLSVPAGKTATLTVTAHNPTDGIVNLPHPLSCTPRLDDTGVCPEMVQTIPAGGSASAQYTIDAQGIAPGRYTLNIEGVLTVPVTVS